MRVFLLLLALIAGALGYWAWANREFDLVALFAVCVATLLAGLLAISRRTS